jgi:glycosyltransferase involved in cell wall biosynthesis
MTRLSIVVCTHNPRPDYLERVLRALAVQSLPMAQWELLLIDNASDEPLAPQHDLSWHPRVRVLREDELGLTPARLRGIAESDGDVLVFVDDDNVLAGDYLQTVQALLQAHPFLGAIGPGVIAPEFAVTPQRSLEPYLDALALRAAGSVLWSNHARDRACVPWGAGLCVTRPVASAYRALVDRLDRERLLDRRGPQLFGNGDVAFSWAATELGLGFGVFPQLRATHLIRAERLTEAYLLRLAHDSTYSNSVSDYLYFGTVPGSGAPRWRELLHLSLQALRRGPFALRMGWARLRGSDRARALIALKGLQPMHREPTPWR